MSGSDQGDAMKAVDEAFSDGVKHLFGVLVQGLIVDSNRDELTERFKRGLAHYCDAHGKATAAVIDYFAGLRP